MNHLRTSLFGLTAFCVNVAFASAAVAQAKAQPAPASAQSDPNNPRTLFRQAAAAFAAGRSAEARKLLLDAWAIRRTYDVAAALGQAELELKLYRDAAEHLVFAVENFAPAESERSLEGVQADLRAAKAHVAEVRITVNDPAAEVFMNGKKVERPSPSAPIFTEPGSHSFEARVDARRSAAKTGTFAANSAYSVDLIVPAELRGAGPALPAPSGRPSDDARANWLPTYVTGGLAVVALGIGTGFTIDALSAKSKGEDKLAAAKAAFGSDSTCTPGNGGGSPLCDNLKSLQDQRKGSNTAATVSFVAGGLLAAASVGSYFLWARQPDDGPQVSASVGNGGGSLLIQGTF